MASIKGPRSALTDFIEENNIKIRPNGFINDNLLLEKPVKPVEQRKKRVKRVKKQMPVELVNLDTINKTDKDIKVEEILENLENINYLEDDQLRDISSYLSRHRIYNRNFIAKIIKLSSDNLVIYDCSDIKDEDYIINKNLKVLELYQCGQLTSSRINKILKAQKKLEVLRLTGGYLVTELELPKSLKVLDLTNCSRLDDRIITEINRKYKTLEELRLSFCYKINGNIQLKIPVNKLFLCETKITEDFICNIPKIDQVKALSLNKCPLVNNLPIEFKSIEYLDIEGLTELKNLNICSKLKILNCKQCFNLPLELLSYFESLEILNISYLQFDFDTISYFTFLKELDISWCPSVFDNLIFEILDKFNLEKMYVFGCFGLSPKMSEDSWNNNRRTKVLGNPAETKFLILND
ncbi:hypothetical protein NBO_13g0067 [Nosema bombycis CQ1]|uniref:Uncharacterized protein n=1 Tax=Nosema bombycis (strain CQ1 / CVCC 102059) TaxID=578461 RepID=R0ML09_NOSB1|nr:hypothetical protein NBO_13g0067 [Nosema bombycis CQ1]|eukprot:EOB14890.1 hypothetical protein NBO_13g0067 [Nosema bombycis CQ1]